MKLRYRCLVLDHDDTVVNSTASIHHPCFQAYLNQVRPGATISLTDYLLANFSPGFPEMCRQRYRLSEEELTQELAFWKRYVAQHTPIAYPGIAALLQQYCAAGGIICVVSHSLSAYILRDYAANGLPAPELVFGWDAPPQQRKPYPYPLLEIMRRLCLTPAQLLMVDDAKPGYTMARSCGVDFAAAGWAYDLAPISDFMQQHCDYYLPSIDALAQLLLTEPDVPQH